jgi:hypothetical protein
MRVVRRNACSHELALSAFFVVVVVVMWRGAQGCLLETTQAGSRRDPPQPLGRGER